MIRQSSSILPENLTPTWRNAILAVVGALFIWFVWSIRAVVNPLLLGYLAAYILHPLVLKLESRGLKRRRAVNVIFLVGIVGTIVITGGIFLQGQALVRDVVSNENVRGQINQAIEQSRTKIKDTVGIELPEIDLQSIYRESVEFLTDSAKSMAIGEEAAAEGTAEEGGSRVRDLGVRTAGTVWKRVSGAFGSLFAIGGLLFLVPLYAYYLLFSLGRMHASMRRYLPKDDRETISNIGRQMGEMLAAFFRGRFSVCLIKGLLISAGLMVAGFDYAFLFGMTAGFLSIIPFIGPLIGFVVTIIASIPSFPIEGAEGAVEGFDVLAVFIRAAIVFGVAELIEGYVLMPKILGDSLRMNEVEVLFYLMAGGAAMGMFGILLALPIAAAIKILLSEVILPALASFADEGGHHGPVGQPAEDTETSET